jgi:hypothetical protein
MKQALAMAAFHYCTVVAGKEILFSSCIYTLPARSPCKIKHSVLFRVIMLHRSVSLTETELCFEYSHMINKALEMISEETPKNFIPSIPTDAQAQP